MNFKIIILLYIITKSTRCADDSDDSMVQDSMDLSEGCPYQKYCRQGTHVVCLYHDKGSLYGPRCTDLVKVEFTPNMIHHILENVNYLRGKIATGKETGKYNEVFPRAYGLMKVEWDKELAFSAQVLANQCLGDKEDECRATDKFPNPSQTIGVIRYKYPSWEYWSSNNTGRGINEIKAIFAVDTILKFIHKARRNITKDDLTKCPSLNDLADINLKHYLYLVHGGVTHIGCGISAYSRTINDSNIRGSKQNNLQIVCNFSEKPKPNQSVYNIVPPKPGKGYSNRCGCPKGYKETSSCLCERRTKNLRRGLQFRNQNKKNIEAESPERYGRLEQAQHFISNSRDIILLPMPIPKRRNLQENPRDGKKAKKATTKAVTTKAVTTKAVTTTKARKHKH